jgi:ubiquinone biosynthesis protein UbiJ
LIAEALNHLLRQNPWAADQLRPYAGRTVQLSLSPVSAMLTLVDNGEFVPAMDGAIADASIALTPISALHFLAKRELPRSDLALDGDTELATAVGKVLQRLEWEYEEDLSRLVGDIPAHEIVALGRKMMAEGRRQFWSLAGMFAEYWLEEQPLIAKRRHLEHFAREVDRLRDDSERLAKRLKKLEEKT